MKNWLKILGVIFVIIFYIISINIFANLISVSSHNYEISKTTIGGSSVKINIGQSVGVRVTRPRFYGTIIVSNGTEYLYLFNLIGLPKKIKNYNFIWFHLIFLVSIILFSILIFTKKKIYKGENSYLKHEKLGEDYINNP